VAFTKKNIPSKILCIIDIGSYKLRVCAASFKNKEIKILGYTEKRQDISFFSNGECRNLPALCENIGECIARLEETCAVPLDQIVINYPFGELFLSSKKINYKRKLPHNTLQKEELETIMQSVEKLCLKHLASEVDRLYGLSPQDIQIILSRVNSVTIDGMKQKKVISKTGEHLRFSLLNAFIPRSKHNLLAQIGNVV
jgi:cell division ATPase FtsA